jgi:YHS domain-containing protein
MSIRQIPRRRTVYDKEWHCDGPNHQGDTYMDCDTITVSHGYGSDYDCETHHFCSHECMRDWCSNPSHSPDGGIYGPPPKKRRSKTAA